MISFKKKQKHVGCFFKAVAIRLWILKGSGYRYACGSWNLKWLNTPLVT